jgi:hypothetical protein
MRSDASTQTPVARPVGDQPDLVAVAVAIDRTRFAEALVALTTDPPGAAELPGRLCAACLKALPVDGVGVTLMTNEPGARALLGATDAVGDRIEDLQYELGEGPCVAAFSDGEPVLVPDLHARDVQARWPMFIREVVATGARALFAFPLQVGTIGIGVLDIYRLHAGPLDEIPEALAIADAVTTALLNYQSQTPPQEADLFDVSWRNHAVVHQATGALAAQEEISTADALARLRAHAFRASRPVHAVAADVMNRKLHLSAEDE